MDLISEIWDRATSAQPPPSGLTVALTALIAFVLVVFPPTWLVVRFLVTITHEGAHAFVSVLVGRRLQGIQLRNDTSGVTLSKGKPTGPGMVLMLAAGYLGPAVVGLGAALLLLNGYSLGVLWLIVALLAVMLLFIRNAFGFLVVIVGVVVMVGVTWFLPPTVQSTIAYLLTWLLLFAAPKPLIELALQRRKGQARNSDADQLARISHIPAAMWIFFFLLADLLGLLVGIWLLLPALVEMVTGWF